LPPISKRCSQADPPKTPLKNDDAKSDAKIIKPEEAKDYEGKEVTVEFKVAAARKLPAACVLNSPAIATIRRLTALLEKRH